MRRCHGLAALGGLAVLALCPALAPAAGYKVTYLVSDIPGLAQITDPNLTNPWGIALSASSPFWISNADSMTATVYSGDVNGRPLSRSSTVVQIPGPPTGQVAGAGTEFNGDHFIFSTLNGLICGWASGGTAATRATTPGGSYNGLAIGVGSDGNHYLWAANTRAGTIDVFDTNYNPTTAPGGFIDAGLDPSYSPYNIQLIQGYLYVAYLDTANGVQGGAVNVFDTDGNLQYRFATDGPLNAPWGMALAPANWGHRSNYMLIGNFGDGLINVFDVYGNYRGPLSNRNHRPFVFENLWALSFGNGGSGGDTNALYFTAGINNQADGLLGSIRWRHR